MRRARLSVAVVNLSHDRRHNVVNSVSVWNNLVSRWRRQWINALMCGFLPVVTNTFRIGISCLSTYLFMWLLVHRSYSIYLTAQKAWHLLTTSLLTTSWYTKEMQKEYAGVQSDSLNEYIEWTINNQWIISLVLSVFRHFQHNRFKPTH